MTIHHISAAMRAADTKTAHLPRFLKVNCYAVPIVFLVLVYADQSSAHLIGGEVSAWDGDAVSGTTALDTIDGNNGTMLGGVGIAPGIFGNAFAFDGSNDRISIGNPANLNFGTGAFSFETWFNWDGGGSSQNNIIRKSNFPVTGPAVGYWLRIDRGSSALDFFSGESPGTFGEISTLLTPNAWHHAVGTRNGTGLMSLYVDGLFRGSVSGPTGGNTTGPAPFTIGAWDDRFGVIELFSGRIDRVGFYNRALTPDEVTHLFLNHVPEPASWALVGTGFIAMSCRRRHKS